MDGRVILREQVIADDGGDLRSVALAEFPDNGFEPFRPHVVRGRVDEVADLRLRLDGCEHRVPVRVCRPDKAGAVPALAVRIGVEGVAAEPPGDGGPRGLVRSEFVLDAEGAALQPVRQASAGPHVSGPVGSGQHPRRHAVRIGECQHAAGFGVEAVGCNPIAVAGPGAFEPALEVLPIQQKNRHGIGRIGKEHIGHGAELSCRLRIRSGLR